MPHILKNNNLEVHIDAPDENYNFSRFDWTGKITNIRFQNIPISTIERTDDVNENHIGKGFYNEFGIKSTIGFDEAKIGGWFHKIGIGLLKKTTVNYSGATPYEIRPAQFEVETEPESISISCKSEEMAGYSYVLKKIITLNDNGFTIDYTLRNTGEKDIQTEEYVHNFLAVNKELIGSDYQLKFPFQINPELFTKTVNQEHKVEFDGDTIKFNGSPKAQFYFRKLSGDNSEIANWNLTNLKHNLVISESTDFPTTKIDVWGWKHVISPELFYHVDVKSGQSVEWSRRYSVYKLN